MKHNFVSDDIKHLALNDYLEGNDSMQKVAMKYKIHYNTLCSFKREHLKYANEYNLYLANKKEGIEIPKPNINDYEVKKIRPTIKDKAMKEAIDNAVKEVEEKKELLVKKEDKKDSFVKPELKKEVDDFINKKCTTTKYKELPEPKLKHRELDVPKHREFEVPKHREFEVPKHREFEVPKHREFEVPKHKELNVPKHREFEVPKHKELDVPKHKELNVHRHKELQVPKHKELEVTRHRHHEDTKPDKSKSFKIVSYEDEITKLINGTM
jgi:hypothetical protein